MAKHKKTFDVDTRPSKEVVVKSLTRDATVEACIFDLIDNAVDAARSKLKPGPGDATPGYAGFEIKLTVTGSAFKIEDNCGGISTHDLRTMVMRFGQRSAHKMGIGVFGVGLNRAIFRLGKLINLTTDTGKERSELVLNVDKYLEKDDDDWNLPAASFPSQGHAGTSIEITKIPEEITQQFADSKWINGIRQQIGQRYARFLQHGLSIALNTKPAKDQEIPLRENGVMDGESKFYKTADDVSIYIQYGQHRDHRFSNEPDYDIEKNKKLTEQYGWTILCNDRAILIADTSDKTGWETKFHSEFYGFVGRVNFVCEDPSKLPWSTTKTDVDLNNHAYWSARKTMKEFAENWRKFAQHRKKIAVLKPIPPKAASKPSTAPKPSKTTSKKPIVAIKPDHHQFRTVLPQDVQETYCDDKHLAVIHEAKQVDLGETPYIGMVLIRVLFEISVAKLLFRQGKLEELKQHAITTRKAAGLKIKDEKNVWPKMDEILPYLENNMGVWGAKHPQIKHSLKRMVTHGPMLNSAVHNPFQIIPKTKAFEIRDEVLPILRHLIETEK